MCSFLVLVLILQFCVSFPAVAGDCYDESKDYNNCDTCYQTLANALLNTDDNKYQLGRTFFPDSSVPPVVVKVVYVPEAQCNTTKHNASEQDPDDNTTRTWYWLQGEMYIYQPLKVFSLRSLFFSPPSWRQESVVLCLPKQCLPGNESNTYENFFKFLTQRVSCSPILSHNK